MTIRPNPRNGPAKATLPPAGALDPRIRTADYSEGQVYRITGFFGFHALIMFAPDERVEGGGVLEAADELDELHFAHAPSALRRGPRQQGLRCAP